jgi:hypothetical protein
MNEHIQKTLNKTNYVLAKNTPSILTGLGVIGVISTGILAARATPIAQRALDQVAVEHEFKYPTEDTVPLTRKEKIMAVLPAYAPAVASGALTIFCIVAANSIHLKRNAALASVIGIIQTGIQTYQEKVIEAVGEKKEELIRGEVAEERLKKNPVKENNVIMLGEETSYCYDSFSGRYFTSSMERINQARNDFNHLLLIRDYLSLNDFYEFLGLPAIEIGNNVGWVLYNGRKDLLELKFSSKVASNGKPCLVIDYMVQPIKI